MKYIVLFFAFLFPALISAQTTPSLYDEWSPELAGTVMHVKITNHEIILRHKASGLITGIPQFLSAPMPESVNPASPTERKESLPEKLDTVRLLKVVFDSVKAKGRLFVQFKEADSAIIPFTFLIKDNGEVSIGIGLNPFVMLTGKRNMKSLKEVEKLSSPSQRNKRKKGTALGESDYGWFDNFSFTFYNKSRTDEFAKMKDPVVMPKEELIGMMNSFGDRLAAEFQKMPQDKASNNPMAMFGFMGPLFKTVPQIAHDLFVAHGYNPLGVSTLVEKFKGDTSLDAAGKLLQDKIEQSIPALREQKRQRDSATEARKNEELIPYGNDEAGIAEARKLMDLKSPVYDATGTLTKEQTENLLQKLNGYADKKLSAVRISVVIVSSLHGNTAEKAANMVSEWNKKGGSVIFLAKDDRKGYIHTGGVLTWSTPDSVIAKIFDEILTPSVKQGNYYEGIDKTIDALVDESNNQIVHSQEMIKQIAAPPPAPPPPPAPADDKDHE
jgi:hypothetical protein